MIFGTNPKNRFLGGFAATHAPRPWLKWYGLHDGLGLAEGFPEVGGAARATEIFGTNPKSV